MTKEIKRFCEEFGIKESDVDWGQSQEDITEQIMDLFSNNNYDFLDDFEDIVGYPFIEYSIVDECREAFINGYNDKKEEGYIWGLYSEEIDCSGDNNTIEGRSYWYWFGYNDNQAYGEGILES